MKEGTVRKNPKCQPDLAGDDCAIVNQSRAGATLDHLCRSHRTLHRRLRLDASEYLIFLYNILKTYLMLARGLTVRSRMTSIICIMLA